MLTTISCNFPYLTAWMDSQEFYFDGFEQGLIKDQYVKYARKTSIKVDDDFHIEIIRLLWPNELLERNSFTYTVDHTVNIRSNTSKSFIEFEKIVFQFKRIIEIAINEPIDVDYHSATSANPSDKGIRLFRAARKGITKKKSNDYRSPSFILFSHKHLGEVKFKSVLENWFKTFQSHGVIYDIYIDTMKWFQGTKAQLSSVMFNNRILNVIQALESFHNIEHEGEDESKEIFKEGFKLILAKLDAQDKKWLKKRTFASTKQLKERIRELLNDFDTVFKGIFHNSDDEAKFAERLCEIRNSLSHGRHKKTDMVSEVRDYYNLSRLLLISCILNKLGFVKDEIALILEQSSEFGPRMRWFREHNIFINDK